MNKSIIYLFGLLVISVFSYGCIDAVASPNSKLDIEKDISNNQRIPSAETKAYWYDGKAEVSSYKLTQARYGELHAGTAVLVYVTEPFSSKSNTKADEHRASNIPVLKLNKTKKFETGIYPYSMMSSTFFPFENGNSSLKISSSIQEWCGMTYMEMKNRSKLIFNLNSYFEGSSFENKKLKKDILEDDLWSIIRLNPEALPVGEFDIIPSMFYLKLSHKEVKSYKAVVTLTKGDKKRNLYEISYPELERSVKIKYANDFPHSILGWEETTYSGFGDNKKLLTSKAELKNILKTDYWNKNQNKDKHIRKELGL